VDEAMISCSIAERQRDVAEAQLQLAAQEKVTALVHLSELASALHDRANAEDQQVRFTCWPEIILSNFRLVLAQVLWNGFLCLCWTDV
jgi:hypothetical protein